MTSRTTRRRWAGLAMATLAAMILQPVAQATPQLADLKVKQSMSVQAGTQVSLKGKTLTAIPLASYTAANVTDGKMVGYDLTTIPALRDAIASAAEDIGATQKDLNVNGTLAPMVWVVRTLTDTPIHGAADCVISATASPNRTRSSNSKARSSRNSMLPETPFQPEQC